MTVYNVITQFPVTHAEIIHILCEAALGHVTRLSQGYRDVETALSAPQLHSALCASVDTHLLTYLLNPWCRVLFEKLTGLQLVKKFPAFHGTRRFITALTSVRYLPLSWATHTQSSVTCPYPGPAQSSRYTHIPPPGDPS